MVDFVELFRAKGRRSIDGVKGWERSHWGKLVTMLGSAVAGPSWGEVGAGHLGERLLRAILGRGWCGPSWGFPPRSGGNGLFIGEVKPPPPTKRHYYRFAGVIPTTKAQKRL
jgi:hypothetical protein